MAEHSPNYLADGLIKIGINDLQGNRLRDICVDTLVLKLLCEECELANGIKPGDKPTSTFLQDLAKRIRETGLDADCSATVAYQLWHAASEAISILKKNTSETLSLPSGSTRRPRDKAPTGNLRKAKK